MNTQNFSQFGGVFIVLFTVLVILELIFKGYALWRAGNAKDKTWFICLFIFNTLGILPAIYLLTHKKAK